MNFVQPWLWFKGIEIGKRGNCDVKALLLVGPVRVYDKGWVITFRVFSVIAAILAVVALTKVMLLIWNLSDIEEEKELIGDEGNTSMPAPARVVFNLTTEGEGERGDSVSGSPSDQEEAKDVGNTVNTVLWPLIGAQVFFGGLAIVQTEMTIWINDIHLNASLTSSGQMIALMIGATTLCVTLVNGALFLREAREVTKKTEIRVVGN